MAQPGVLSADELAAIADGALPTAARRRLEELAGVAGMSTSFFSPAEDALAPGLDLEVLGQVIGAAGARLLLGVLRAFGPGSAARHRPGDARWLERSGTVESWTRARRRAVWRIQEQAAILGADAVLGVEVARRQHEYVAEVVLTGTAVRLGGRVAGRPVVAGISVGGGAAGRPVVAGISVAQLSKLRAAGAEPVGLVGGCAAVAALPSSATRRALRRRRRRRTSRELDEFTFAFTEARRRAVDRLRVEAGGLGARGVIGIKLGDLSAVRAGGGDYEVVVHVIGTAVRRPPGLAGRPGVSAGRPIDLTLRTGANPA